ncbi:MAG: SIMPL domain-containing protein [Firmicutes bacterium]|nr:SIMPL domain-containing protein [Bacillota bacterium]
MDRRKAFMAIGLAVALFCAAAFAGLAGRVQPRAAVAEESSQRVIAATGEATVSAKPDIAYVGLGVQAQADTAREAQSQNSAAMSRVMAALAKLGIANDDIKTSRFNMYPVYDYKPEPDQQPKLVGYRVDNSIRITVRDLSRVGTVLDECVKAGANQVETVTFSLKDATNYRMQALEEAARSSRAEADAMARGLGLTITGIKAVQELSSSVPRYEFTMMDAMPRGMGASAPVAPGQIEVRAEVRVEYTY